MGFADLQTCSCSAGVVEIFYYFFFFVPERVSAAKASSYGYLRERLVAW